MKRGQTDGTVQDEIVLTGSNVVNGGQVKTTLYSSSGIEPPIAYQIDGEVATTNGFVSYGRQLNYNGATFDRVRNNTQGTLLASAARTVTTSSPDQTNHNGRSLDVILNVTSAGTGSITLTVEGKDPVSGLYFPILAGVAVTANGMTVYMVGAGIAEAANVSTNKLIPRTFRITVTANNVNSVTYSVGYALGI